MYSLYFLHFSYYTYITFFKKNNSGNLLGGGILMNQKSKVLDSGWIELILTAKRLGLTDEEIKDYLQNHSSVISFTKDAKKKRVR